MDRSVIYALVLGGVAFAAGVIRVVERFLHISKYGDGQPRPHSQTKDQATPSMQA